MAGNPLSPETNRAPIFKPMVSIEHLTEFYDHISQGKMLYLVVTSQGGNDRVLIAETSHKNIKHCYVFWKRTDARMYINYSGLTPSETQIWTTGVDDLINFIKKVTQEEEIIDILVGTFKGENLAIVDTLWPPTDSFMV